MHTIIRKNLVGETATAGCWLLGEPWVSLTEDEPSGRTGESDVVRPGVRASALSPTETQWESEDIAQGVNREIQWQGPCIYAPQDPLPIRRRICSMLGDTFVRPCGSSSESGHSLQGRSTSLGCRNNRVGQSATVTITISLVAKHLAQILRPFRRRTTAKYCGHSDSTLP